MTGVGFEKGSRRGKGCADLGGDLEDVMRDYCPESAVKPCILLYLRTGRPPEFGEEKVGDGLMVTL